MTGLDSGRAQKDDALVYFRESFTLRTGMAESNS